MKLLLDECVPRKLKFAFSEYGHECHTVREVGLGSQANDALLALAEGHFDVLITIDKNIRYQQNLTGRNIAILIVHAPSNDISDIRPHIPEALAALNPFGPAKLLRLVKSKGHWRVRRVSCPLEP